MHAPRDKISSYLEILTTIENHKGSQKMDITEAGSFAFFLSKLLISF